MTEPSLASADEALVRLGKALSALQYRFITVTPSTHALVNARESGEATDLRDVFGWSRSFRASLLPAELFDLLHGSGALRSDQQGVYRSAVRFSSCGKQLLVHSAFPTIEPDSVFFGPDTYRFVRLLLRVNKTGTVFDVGCGGGAGGLSLLGRAQRIIFADLNPNAIRFTRVNAALAGVSAVQTMECDLFGRFAEPIDLIIANPPYLNDDLGRAYRHGGGLLGTGLARRIVAEGLPRLAPNGRLLLYSAAPVRRGVDLLWGQLEPLLNQAGFDHAYEELDPDVFGEELARPAYAEVERLAVVSLEVCRC